jgi:hypothetical protein
MGLDAGAIAGISIAIAAVGVVAAVAVCLFGDNLFQKCKISKRNRLLRAQEKSRRAQSVASNILDLYGALKTANAEMLKAIKMIQAGNGWQPDEYNSRVWIDGLGAHADSLWKALVEVENERGDSWLEIDNNYFAFKQTLSDIGHNRYHVASDFFDNQIFVQGLHDTAVHCREFLEKMGGGTGTTCERLASVFEEDSGAADHLLEQQ